MYYLSAYEIVNEVAALTGKVVNLQYGGNFSVGRCGEDIVLTVPAGTSYITAHVRSGILHETLHIMHTTTFTGCFDPLKHLTEDGAKEYEVGPLFYFMNAFEDIRIQLKGETELPGARYIFQAGHDEIFPHVVREIQDIYYAPFGRARAYSLAAICYLPEYTPLEPVSQYEKDFNAYSSDCGFLSRVSALAKEAGLTNLEWMREFCAALEETATTEQGFELAAKYFLDDYKKTLPSNLQQLYDDAKKLEELKRKLFEALKQAAKDYENSGKPSECGLPLTEAVTGGDKARQKKLEELIRRSGGGYGRDRGEKLTARGKVIDQLADECKVRLATILDRVREWQERSYERTGLKRGRIDPARLHHVAVKEYDVFRRNEEPELTDDVAYSVVVDVSGSMMGGETTRDPLNTAFGLGVGINRALEKIKKPCSVIAFSSGAVVVARSGDKCDINRIETSLSEAGGGTDIAAGIAQGLHEMAGRTEVGKYMFIFSDGDVSPQHLTGLAKDFRAAGVQPYFIYMVRGNKESYSSAFKDLQADFDKEHMKLSYAVVDNKEGRDSLIPQLTAFITDTLEGKR